MQHPPEPLAWWTLAASCATLVSTLVGVVAMLIRVGMWAGMLEALREAFEDHEKLDQHRFERMEERLAATRHRS